MKSVFVLLAVGCLLSAALAVQPGFDAGEVVRRVCNQTRPASGFEEGYDDGEFLVDTAGNHASCPFDENVPAIACDGSGYLLVWEDERSGHFDIYGCRVTAQGEVLDPAGIGIAFAGHHQRQPAVAFDGTNFLVVWTDVGMGPGNANICGARVTADGSVLEPAGFVISGAAGNQVSASVAFDGASFLVAWEDARGGGADIYACRVTQQGTVLDPSGIAVSVAGGTQKNPSVSFGGDEFVVVWEDTRSGNSDIYGCRLTPQGAVLDPAGIPVSSAPSAQTFASAAFDGSEFLVVWEDRRNGDSDIYGCRVEPSGAVLDTAGIAISTTAADQHLPAVGFDGTNFLCGWQASGRSFICGCRVTPQGTVLDSALITLSAAAGIRECAALGVGSGSCLVVWADSRGGELDIYGCRVTPHGLVLDPDGLRLGAVSVCEASPAASFDGTNFLVAWEEYDRDSSWDICGARVATDGTVLDPQGISISRRAGDQLTPAVAFDGENSLLVWTAEGGPGAADIIGARVTPAGVVLDPAGLVISGAANAQYSPAAAFDGANFLVAWEDYRGGASDIYVCRVTPAGVVLDPAGIAVSTASGYQYWSAIAFDGASYLVVWTDQRGTYTDIYGCRVTPSGTVLDPMGIAISTAAGHQYRPVLDFDGTNFLVAWEDGRDGPLSIHGCRVTPQGVALDADGISISPTGVHQRSPALDFDGADYLAVWADYRSGRPDIYGARVRPDGTVHDGGAIVHQDGEQLYPALARGSGNQMLLAYQGWAGVVGSETCNDYRIWGKMDPSPAVEEKTKSEERATNDPTIIRGVLVLGAAGSRQITEHRADLLDAAGRKVAQLRVGANDVGHLAPGVYFCRQTAGFASSAQASSVVRGEASVTKVIITR